MLSRNAASSRAIPLKKMIERIEKEPAMPVYWGAEQKGMQSGLELDEFQKVAAKDVWMRACRSAIDFARAMGECGVHKSISNRILEPFAHMTTLATATEWVNFFNLRAHKDAQPEFQVLAYAMLDAYEKNDPVMKKSGEWHLPFADKYLSEGLDEFQLCKISTARSARTSYLTMEGEIDHAKDYDLCDRLAGSRPGHWSPFEHPAQCTPGVTEGNFQGWTQYRKFFKDENMSILDVIKK
jgi:hypothetical protein